MVFRIDEETELDDMIFEIKSTYINDHGLVHQESEEATGLDFVKLKLNRQINRFYNIVIPIDLRICKSPREQKKQLMQYCEDHNRSFVIDVGIVC